MDNSPYTGWTRQTWEDLADRLLAPGSPYWASEAFAGLVLPADHPVWTDVEEPLAIELGDVAVTLRPPGWLVSRTAADGVVRLAGRWRGTR